MEIWERAYLSCLSQNIEQNPSLPSILIIDFLHYTIQFVTLSLFLFFLIFFSHKKQCILFSKWFPLVIKSSWKSRPKVWEIAKIDVFWVGQVSHV